MCSSSRLCTRAHPAQAFQTPISTSVTQPRRFFKWQSSAAQRSCCPTAPKKSLFESRPFSPVRSRHNRAEHAGASSAHYPCRRRQCTGVCPPALPGLNLSPHTGVYFGYVFGPGQGNADRERSAHRRSVRRSCLTVHAKPGNRGSPLRPCSLRPYPARSLWGPLRHAKGGCRSRRWQRHAVFGQRWWDACFSRAVGEAFSCAKSSAASCRTPRSLSDAAIRSSSLIAWRVPT